MTATHPLRATHGPGPHILGVDRTNPDLFIVQHPDGTVDTMTREQIAAIPIRHQWFTGTPNGLIATWPNYEIAEHHAFKDFPGVLLGQVLPASVRWLASNGWDNVVILADSNGRPMKGA